MNYYVYALKIKIKSMNRQHASSVHNSTNRFCLNVILIIHKTIEMAQLSLALLQNVAHGQSQRTILDKSKQTYMSSASLLQWRFKSSVSSESSNICTENIYRSNSYSVAQN